jgi:hypothetical protein
MDVRQWAFESNRIESNESIKQLKRIDDTSVVYHKESHALHEHACVLFTRPRVTQTCGGTSFLFLVPLGHSDY